VKEEEHQLPVRLVVWIEAANTKLQTSLAPGGMSQEAIAGGSDGSPTQIRRNSAFGQLMTEHILNNTLRTNKRDLDREVSGRQLDRQ
jgi:hypothetical protein